MVCVRSSGYVSICGAVVSTLEDAWRGSVFDAQLGDRRRLRSGTESVEVGARPGIVCEAGLRCLVVDLGIGRVGEPGAAAELRLDAYSGEALETGINHEDT